MTVATYVRVSTEEQSLERQLESTHEYATGSFGADPVDVEVYRDKSTGTDTSRDGYRDLMAAVDAGEHDAVVVHSVSRISRSIRDLDRTVERIVEDAATEVHFISEGLVIRPDDDDPFQNAVFRLLGVFAELEAEMAQKRTREGIQTRMQEEDYHHGPPPLGFQKDDGYLIEADGYDRVRTVLEMVLEQEMSKRQAAKELETSRRTVNRSLERLELYGLEHLADKVADAGGEPGKVANQQWGDDDD